jgi:hypothetical protein
VVTNKIHETIVIDRMFSIVNPKATNTIRTVSATFIISIDANQHRCVWPANFGDNDTKVTPPFRKRLLASNIRSMGRDNINTHIRINHADNEDPGLRMNYGDVVTGHSDTPTTD